MPSVLLMLPVNDIGGGETVLLNLIRYRERTDLEYRALILADTDGPLAAAFESLGVSVARVSRGRMGNPVSLLSAISAVRRENARAKPDVLLANSSQGFLYGRWASGRRIPGALYFMSVPDPALVRNNPLDVLARLTPPRAIFAASNAIRRALETCGFHNVTTVYHGAPEPVATAEQRSTLARRLDTMGVPSGAPVVLMPGRLQRWKGQLLFVRAFAGIASACPEAHAVILGAAMFGHDAEFAEELRSEIARFGLERRVHLPGQDAVAPWLERAACVVHASLQPDAFPNVCIEALASHRPLVTNTSCGVAEILTPGRDAWVVSPSDSAALGAAIADVLRNAAGAARVAEEGHRRYVENCTPVKMTRPIESTLMRIAGYDA